MEKKEQVEERKPQKRRPWDCNRLLEVESAFGKGSGCRAMAPALRLWGWDEGAGCSLCDRSPSAGCRRSLVETELEIQVQEETRLLGVAEATVAAVDIGEGRQSTGGIFGIT